MIKTGRNDPCFCGSGKKYKKCCFGCSDPNRPFTHEKVDTKKDYSDTIHPYQISRMGSDLALLKRLELTKKQIKKLCKRWSMHKLMQLDTAQIVQQLSVFGIDAEKDAFIAFAQGEISAWNVAQLWLEDIEYMETGDDEDFVCLAACELWKRYLPERPSMEMVDDWVQEGYDLEGAGKPEEACGQWQKVWARMLMLFSPEMTTFSDVSPVFNFSQCFMNWIQDYEICLDNLIASDESWLEIGIPFIEQAEKQFAKEPGMIVLRCTLGRWLVKAERVDDGMRLFDSIISSYPNKCNGYVGLAEVLRQPGKPWFDPKRAIQLVKQAKSACPQSELEEWDLENLLTDVAH